jgi:hypothetical protein
MGPNLYCTGDQTYNGTEPEPIIEVNLCIGVPAAVVNPGEDGQHGGGEPCGGPLAQAVAVREVNAPKNNLKIVKKCKKYFVAGLIT